MQLVEKVKEERDMVFGKNLKENNNNNNLLECPE